MSAVDRGRRGAPVLLSLTLAVLLAACGGGAGAPEPSASPWATAAPAGPTTASEAASAGSSSEGEDPTAAGGAAASAGATAAPSSGAGGAPVDAAGGVEAVLAGLTPAQKVGQLLAVAVVGDDATAVSDAAAEANLARFGVRTPAEVVAAYDLGGVAYFAHDLGERTSNTGDLAATARLSEGLQAAAAADSGVGLLIGADQEGGAVVRLRAPATVFPAARRVAEAGDVDLARRVGAVTGAEARAVGISWVYAPVADVNVDPANPVIGDRAFGTTAEATSPFVVATAQGLAEAGVLPTAKHFPGHGDTSVDSHSSLPVIDHSPDELAAVDLPPFAAVVGAVDPVTVMVGHLAVPAVDPSGRPATISRPILDLLRGAPPAGLGFDGLVVTDAMEMGALQGFGDAGQLAVESVLAGVDVVLMPSDLPAAHAALLAAVEDGRITAERLDASVRRVLEAKAAVGVLDPAAATAGIDPSLLGSPANAAVRDELGALCGC